MTRPLRALFLAPYPPDCAPGQRFRFEQWLSLLPRGAVHAEIRPFFSRSAYDGLYEPGRTVRKAAQSAMGLTRRIRDVLSATQWDVAFVFRTAVPLGPPLVEELVARKVPVVYDFDDAIFLGDTSTANRVVARWKRPDSVGAIVALATTTIVGNAWLESYARQFSSQVTVIPTTIDVEKYVPGPRRTAQSICIGWSGSPTTSQHLHTIDSALQMVLARPSTQLLVIGDPSFQLEGVERLSVRPWRREAELDDLRAFDIGIMPLPDDEWSKGKCGLKALQYMAVGTVVVSSPVGVNPQIIIDGRNGLLASDQDEWVTAVRRLVEDPQLRRQLGEAGRQTVVERYSGQRWAPRFLEVLESAASSPA